MSDLSGRRNRLRAGSTDGMKDRLRFECDDSNNRLDDAPVRDSADRRRIAARGVRAGDRAMGDEAFIGVIELLEATLLRHLDQLGADSGLLLRLASCGPSTAS